MKSTKQMSEVSSTRSKVYKIIGGENTQAQEIDGG